MVTRIDAGIYSQKLSIIKKLIQNSKRVCDNLQIVITKLHCSQMLTLFDVQIPQLMNKEETINDLIGLQYRSKRGLINAIGSISKFLFGTMDANDAEHYDDTITKIELDDKNLQMAMKDQIQIITATISTFNDSISKFKDNEEILNINIDKFNKFMRKQNEVNYHLEIKEEITEHFQLLTYMINEMTIEFDEIIDIILFARKNIIHPSLITPRELLNELRKAKQFLSNDKVFPLELSETNINILMNIFKNRLGYRNQKVIFEISLPIVNDKEYFAYKLIPLPIPYPNQLTYAYIQPNFQYLLVSYNKLQYVQLNSLDECTIVLKDNYLCPVNAIYYANNKPICEVKLFVNTIKEIPKDCNTKTLFGNIEIWQNLKSNQWIFVLNRPEKLTIICKEIKEEIIQNTGILTLEDGCKAFALQTQLIANSKTETEYKHIIPTINITMDECCQTNFNNLTF